MVPQPLIHDIDEVTDDGQPAESPVRVRDALSSSSQAATAKHPLEKTELSVISEQTVQGLLGDCNKGAMSNDESKFTLPAGTMSGNLDP